MQFNSKFWPEQEIENKIKEWNYHFEWAQCERGSIYFKSLYRILVFGICEDAIPAQKTYLIKESESTGKGANTVISLVHHYFTHHGLGEKSIIIHADNCTGQNKNNAMIKYLMWRVANGLHNSITYSFMVSEHTKFSPDSFFGLFKLKL
ncbi:chaperonin: PROVISIONAL [Gigaspora margarita]|uniref:Chaperonin: PROVISIONAL n=1 Tax=Gigaspora margarita TaxID=4874 RepID=A0A8H4ANR7_GIGMA|nr:chaperonin: PROVISIONAL [Gigaspora margarita]